MLGYGVTALPRRLPPCCQKFIPSASLVYTLRTHMPKLIRLAHPMVYPSGASRPLVLYRSLPSNSL
jgi:hypothetical protein